MIHQLFAYLTGFVVATISAGGYVGIALLMAIESACIPLPSEIIMPFAGYLVSLGHLDLLLVATAGAIGCNIGSTFAYAVGRYGGRPAIERWGRYLLVSRQELELVERFFRRWGKLTVFAGRLLPVVRTFIALPAGVAQMPQLPFQLYTFLGSWPWCYALAWIGKALGERWETDPRLRELFHQADAAILAVLVLGAVWFVRARWRNRMRAIDKGP